MFNCFKCVYFYYITFSSYYSTVVILIKINPTTNINSLKTDQKIPSFIKEKLQTLNEDQFGFSAFGLKNNTNFKYSELPRELKKKYF